MSRVAFIGSPHVTSGPLAVLPGKLHAAWSRRFSAADGKKLARQVSYKRRVRATRIGRSSALLVHFGRTGCVQQRGMVLLVTHDASGLVAADDEKLIREAPLGAARGWQKQADIELPEGAVLCDVWAGDPGEKSRKRSVPLGLAAGRYLVEMAELEKQKVRVYPRRTELVTFRFVRIRPPGPPPAPVATPAAVADADAGPLVATPEVVRASKALRFAPTGGGGLVLLPRALQSDWGGIDEDTRGNSDYGLASTVKQLGVVRFRGARALVINNPWATAFHPTPRGGLFIQWIGADSNAGCLATVLSIPDDEWSKTATVFEADGRPLALFDSGEPGGKVGKRAQAEVRVARGRYRIETCWNFEAEVRVGRRVEDVTIAALRLTRSASR